MLPLNMGLNFHTDVGPRLENCPNATSIKKIGSPANTSMITYGIRNAPKSRQIITRNVMAYLFTLLSYEM